MRSQTAKSHLINRINFIVIPLVAITCFFFVMRVVTQQMNVVEANKQVVFETAYVSADAPMAPAAMELRMRDSRAPMYAMRSPAFGQSLPNSSLAMEAPGANRETYQKIDANPLKQVALEPISTFSADVDTGGYTNLRRMLNAGKRPPPDSIRTEEIINYFSYEYPTPLTSETPFTINSEIMLTPWNKDSLILQIGLKGFAEPIEFLPASNLVFLVDVSGSMQSENKLPLVKESLKILTDNLRHNDRVSLITYANGTQLVLPSISGSEQFQIMLEVDRLNAGGGTAGESGLKLAYEQAKAGFIKGGNNRIVIMTDGDFNLGMSGVDDMVELVEAQRQSGIFLSTVGFGEGNYREDMMEQMANHGNGHYTYIDNIAEARRVFERNLRSNLYVIAKDVKIQVEFNPEWVDSYRLIGYENRLLNTEDFSNDKVDAGEIGQGHTVTALYEIIPHKNLFSNTPEALTENADGQTFSADSLAMIKLRYKAIDEDHSTLLESPVVLAEHLQSLPSDNILLATSAAAFGELLRESDLLQDSFNYADILAILGQMTPNYNYDVEEFNQLVLLADSIP